MKRGTGKKTQSNEEEGGIQAMMIAAEFSKFVIKRRAAGYQDILEVALCIFVPNEKRLFIVK